MNIRHTTVSPTPPLEFAAPPRVEAETPKTSESIDTFEGTGAQEDTNYLQAGMITGMFIGGATSILGAMLSHNFGVAIPVGAGIGFLGGFGFCSAVGALSPK